MMEFLECLKNRRSVRVFRQEKVSHEKIKVIVEEASFAPSWKNSQTVSYLVIENEELKKEVANTLATRNQQIVLNAPDLVIVLSKKNIAGYNRDGSFSTTKNQGWEMFDAGIASQTFCLSAYYEGVNTVIMGIFDEQLLKKVLKITDDYAISALIAMGYGVTNPKMPLRKTVSELLEIK